MASLPPRAGPSLRETDEVTSIGFWETVLPDLVPGTMKNSRNVFFAIA